VRPILRQWQSVDGAFDEEKCEADQDESGVGGKLSIESMRWPGGESFPTIGGIRKEQRFRIA
jgi:hypothetical protein